jgi:DNA-binding transcriptional LysR family regulator
VNACFNRVGPYFENIEVELDRLSELRDKPAGTIRITSADHAAIYVLWPTLEKFLPDYPDIKVEVNIDQGLTDIAAQRYDAGVRLGEQVAKDMIAVRIGPDVRMAVVAAPSYFAGVFTTCRGASISRLNACRITVSRYASRPRISEILTVRPLI